MVCPYAEPKRCVWAQSHPLLAAYHDAEWGVPEFDPRALWEKLMLDGFQAGLSWLTILKKREAFRRAFAGFDPVRVARFDDDDVARLMADPGIVRSRAKIEAVIGNARAYLDMQASGEDFAEFVWSFVDHGVQTGDGRHVPTQTEQSKALAVALKKRGFKYVGPTVVYAWMQAVGWSTTMRSIVFVAIRPESPRKRAGIGRVRYGGNALKQRKSSGQGCYRGTIAMRNRSLRRPRSGPSRSRRPSLTAPEKAA